MNANHSISRLKANAPQIGQQCPVRRVPLEAGDEVVICHRRDDEAVSLKGWAAVQDRCPFCGEIVSPTIADRQGINLPVWVFTLGGIGLVVIGLMIGRFLFGGGAGDTESSLVENRSSNNASMADQSPNMEVQVPTFTPTPTPTLTPAALLQDSGTLPTPTNTRTSTPIPTFTSAPTSTSTSTPMSTPTPTRIPTATPTPSATIDADPTVYDNFNNVANDGSFNQNLWGWWAGAANKEEQKSGELVITHKPGTSDDKTGLFAKKYENFSFKQLNFFEAKILLQESSTTGNVQIHMYSNNPEWWAECLVHRYSTGIFTSCISTKWPTESFDYQTEFIQTDFNQWNTVRMEINPETSEFSFYINGQFAGSYIPAEAERLKSSRFTFSIGTWSQDGIIVGHIDDVRIGRLN